MFANTLYIFLSSINNKMTILYSGKQGKSRKVELSNQCIIILYVLLRNYTTLL